MILKLLTKKEIEVMSMLRQYEEPLTAHQFDYADKSFIIHTCHQILQRLLKMNYVIIADMNRSGTAFARFYSPIVSQIDYIYF